MPRQGWFDPELGHKKSFSPNLHANFDPEIVKIPTSSFVGDDDNSWPRFLALAVVATFVAMPAHAYDQHETAVLVGQADEDYWQNRVAPVAGSFVVPQQAGFEQHEQATGLYGVPGDEGWQAPAPWSISAPIPVSIDGDFAQAPTSIVEDDPWPQPQTWNATSVTLTWEQADGVQLVGQPDEDYRLVLPVPDVLTFRVPAPWTGEQHEQANGLIAIPAIDEDFYAPVVLPPVVYVAPQPWTFEQHETANGLRAVPNEEYWENRVVPVPSALVGPAPWIHEQHEVTRLPIQDEDFWWNLVRPVPLAFLVPRPWLADQIEQAAGLLIISQGFAIQDSSAARYGVTDDSGPRYEANHSGALRYGVDV